MRFQSKFPETRFVQAAQAAYLDRLRRTGVVQIPGHDPRKKAPPSSDPTVQSTFHQIETIITASSNVTAWCKEFQQQALFRNNKTAEQVAYALAKLPRGAACQTRQMVREWLQTDDTALLAASAFPYHNELVRLRSWEQALARQIPEPCDRASILRDLRTDVICLTQVLQSDAVNAHYQSYYCPTCSLYDESIWHQPINSAYREQYAARIPAAIQRILLHALQHSRACDAASAAHIMEAYLTGGINALSTWRCQQQDATRDLHLELARTQRAARHLVAGLPDSAQHSILTRLDQLHHALHAARVSLPLYRLVKDLPGSYRRRHAQSIRLPDACVDHFARLTGVSVETAKSLIKNFMVYGPLGLIPLRDWEPLLHPALWSYLHLHKFGRLEWVMSYPRLTETVNAYAQLLDCPSLPQQLVMGICNHFPKDTYFNSGDGAATAGVPRRKSLKLAGVQRLHEEWLVLAVSVEIDVIDHSNRSLGKDCTAVCVFDGGSERAITCCVYLGQIGSRELGLTLYDAIWHPYHIEWPLRGIPETILLPERLVTQDVSGIYAAAYWMHADIQCCSDAAVKKKLARHPFMKETVAALQQQFTPDQLPGRRRAPRQQLTVQDAQATIRQWLYQRGFSGDHRIEHAKLPKRLRDRGDGMPGADTIVAGYLLPVVATAVPTVRDGVEYQGYTYVNPSAKIEPGYTVTLRARQPRPGIPQTVFASYGEPPCLHALALADRVQ